MDGKTEKRSGDSVAAIEHEKAPVLVATGQSRYVAVLACGHSRHLRENWSGVVESDAHGPYEGCCYLNGHGMQRIVAFIGLDTKDEEDADF